MQTSFNGYNIFLRAFKSNKDSFRVEIDLGRDQYDKVKDIPHLPDGVYKITIEPEIEEEK